MTQFKIKLSQAASTSTTNLPGVYIIYYHDKIMKVGSAKIGIQKRMQQYYGLNDFCGLNEYINKQNRDEIKVTYQTCCSCECNELESKLFRKYGPAKQLLWAARQPNSDANTTKLMI